MLIPIDEPMFVMSIALRRFGSSRELVSAIGETFGAWRREEYARVSDAFERVTGKPPRSVNPGAAITAPRSRDPRRSSKTRGVRILRRREA